MTTTQQPDVHPTPFSREAFASELEFSVRHAGAAALIHVLIDLDHLSRLQHELRSNDAALMEQLDSILSSVAAAGEIRLRLVCSPQTAFAHGRVLALLPNSSRQPQTRSAEPLPELVYEIKHLARTPSTTAVVLVSGRGALAGPVSQLVRRGVPTWVLARTRLLSSNLQQAASGCRSLDPLPATGKPLRSVGASTRFRVGALASARSSS